MFYAIACGIQILRMSKCLVIAQVLQVIDIKHKNNASNECLHGNTVLPYRPYKFMAYFNDLWLELEAPVVIVNYARLEVFQSYYV